MLHHRFEDFPPLLKAHLPRRKAPVANGVRGLPALLQLPLALGASGERGRAPGRWSGRRSGGCGGASAGRSPPRAARTPTCCAMGTSPPTSLHEPAATRPTEASGLLPRPWGATYLEAIYPSARPVIGRSARSSSLLEAPFRDRNRYRNPSGSYIILCPQRRLRRSSRCYSLSYTGAIVCARTEKVYEQSFSTAGRRLIWTFHDRWCSRHDVTSRAARCCRSRPSGRKGSTLSPKRSHRGPQRTRGVRKGPPVPP